MAINAITKGCIEKLQQTSVWFARSINSAERRVWNEFRYQILFRAVSRVPRIRPMTGRVPKNDLSILAVSRRQSSSIEHGSISSVVLLVYMRRYLRFRENLIKRHIDHWRRLIFQAGICDVLFRHGNPVLNQRSSARHRAPNQWARTKVTSNSTVRRAVIPLRIKRSRHTGWYLSESRNVNALR